MNPADFQATARRWRLVAGPAILGQWKRPRPSNDNACDAPPLQRYAFDVYRAAGRARWVGRVIAINADAAIEAAAVEFRSDVKKLIAVRQYKIA